MKKSTWIWIGAGIVVLILILVILRAANKSAEAKEDEADRLDDILDDEAYSSGGLGSEQRADRRDMRKTCRQLCKKGRTWAFGGRAKCRRNCKSDWVRYGKDYVLKNY